MIAPLLLGSPMFPAASLRSRIARQIGLIKTMVYTHIPSNLLLTIIPFVSSAPIAVGLLLSRQSLSQMDVPTRQSYLMSVVPENDRTPAAGFTNVSRSIAQISDRSPDRLDQDHGLHTYPFESLIDDHSLCLFRSNCCWSASLSTIPLSDGCAYSSIISDECGAGE